MTRGYLSGGQSDASSYFIQSIIGPPTLDTQPLSRTNNVTTTATFFVAASGESPLNYQWLRDGFPLTNSGKIFGAVIPVLTLTNVFGSDGGGYSVIVSNSSGSITSSIASLTVLEPLITRQPTNQIANAGDTVSFSVTAGSVPIQLAISGAKMAPTSPMQTPRHNSKAVHRAYAKRALMKIPSLEDYEREATAKSIPAP